MELVSIRNEYRDYLKKNLSVNEIDDIFKRVIKFFFNWEGTIVGLNPNKTMSNHQITVLKKTLYQLKKNRPLQYIIGSVSFYKYVFKVNESVLIPRPETEELVQWILEKEKKSSKVVLDIGTGSGCIPITLKLENKSWRVSSIDISLRAIKLAKLNSINLKAKVDFYCKDLFSIDQWDDSLDIIVSNPPYISIYEKKLMKSNVLDYEPFIALFTPEGDPLIFYKKIIDFSINNLKPNGVLYFEINPIFVEKLKFLFNEKFFKQIEIKKDIFNRDRMIRAVKV
tara:strand:+ start:1579 stop:2424 length:846 start_codon:yes stop_codon:yes gene_type:complete